jgi:ATP-binding cassette, subfamily B, multidrug efflux pump
MSQDKRRFLRDSFDATLKQNPVFGLTVVIAVVVGALINTWPSLVLRQIVDESLPNGGLDIWRLGFTYLGFTLLIGVVDLSREYGATVFGQHLLLNIRKLMLDRLSLLPMSYYNTIPAGDTISRFTGDIDAIDSLFTAGLISAIADLLKIVGFLLAIYTISVPIGVIATCSLPVLYLVTNYFRKNMYEKQLAVRRKVSDINTSIHETYTGMKIIKIFGMENYFAERFEPILDTHRLAMNSNAVYVSWFPCVTQTIRAVFISAALVFGATNSGLPIALGLSLGTLAALTDLMIRLFTPISAVSGEIQTIQRALAGVQRVENFFSEEVQMNEAGTHVTDDLPEGVEVVIDDVSFSYDGPVVLNGASLVIPAGTKAAIAGRTGSGKTTLMNLVAGLYSVDHGKVTVGGVDPFELPAEERRRLMGIVPQTIHIFNSSVHDNVTLRDESISREQVEMTLDTVGLLDVVNALPEGLDTFIGEGSQQLSFGQTQLLSLARAIVTDPPLLLLDELTSGLDALTERNVLAAIRGVSEGRSILTISHRLSGIIDAEMVHIMDRGRIMESGSPEELVDKGGWYSIYKNIEDRGWKMV